MRVPDGEYVVFRGVEITMPLTPECATPKEAYSKLCEILDPRTQRAISEYSTEHSMYAVGSAQGEHPSSDTTNLWPK